MSKTTILVESGTRKKLKEIGRKDQTYDALINDLIETKKNQNSHDSRGGILRSSESLSP
jgi:hypothetical protein